MSTVPIGVHREALKKGHERFMERSKDVDQFKKYWSDSVSARKGEVPQPLNIMISKLPTITEGVNHTCHVIRADQSTIAENLLSSYLAYQRTEADNIEQTKQIWDERGAAPGQVRATDLRSLGHLSALPSTTLKPAEAHLERTWKWASDLIYLKVPGSIDVWEAILEWTGIDLPGAIEHNARLFAGDWAVLDRVGDAARNMARGITVISGTTRSEAGVFIGTSDSSEQWTGPSAQLARHHCSLTAERLMPVAKEFDRMADAFETAASAMHQRGEELKALMDHVLQPLGVLGQLVAVGATLLKGPQNIHQTISTFIALFSQATLDVNQALKIGHAILRASELLKSTALSIGSSLYTYQPMKD